ncbi:MAG: hypothetical protein DMG74_14480 [Acidobacteria bacterium]|nr:MAG: hypothetical protein DMG74_14480 [Acidobacteriota bacterium]
MDDQLNRVLLIEDNPGDADLVRLRLVEGESHMDVRCANRLATGLTSLSDEPPAVVLLDLNLPDSQGADTFRRVLDKAPGVPVIILSGRDDESLAVKVLHQGVQDYLVKGEFDSKQLFRAMRYAMEREVLLKSLEMGVAGPVVPQQRKHLETALKSVTQLHAMIRDLLEAGKAESGQIHLEPRCIVISELIQQTIAMVRRTAREKQIGVDIAVDSRIPLIYADPDRILQVLVNLIDNAIKFTEPDGSIMVKASLVDADPSFVYVSVVDTGRGISAEAKLMIFERLYQDPNALDNNRKGLGLGLYIAKELVRLHGGRLWVSSEPGQGSIFSFTLPLFALSKLLFPGITDQACLRDPLALVRVEFRPLSTPRMWNWKDVCQRCLTTLGNCVFVDRELVLPAMADVGQFFIVSSVEEQGGQIVERIGKKLDACSDLRASGTFHLSVTTISPPARVPDQSVEELVQEVANRVTEMVMLDVRPNRTPSSN